ncbi:hypothetical protein [Pedobacter namyangjuensis]|uniref:hypothetical protein n=1 Tax=Pedobacter namyangjuensis TaxID=600626 RepID=UPI000DE4CF4C|nr:hypothetical protein [Pedobacter namyangjuensis]
MKIFSRFFITALLMSFAFAGKSQFLKEIESDFIKYKANNFQEKIFLHTDKENYISGEILWLKAYLVNDVDGKPADLSKVCYIELVDKENTPVEQVKILLKNGSGNGSILVNSFYKSGVYKLRAYTNWMKNYGENFYYEKTITLINPSLAPEKPLIANSNLILQFFPEGGNLVAGLNGVVGIKCVDNFGFGVDVQGAIVNQKNDTIAKFDTFKFGIGRFSFTPKENEVYRVVVNSSKNYAVKSFPTVQKVGYTIALKGSATEIDINVANNLGITKSYLVIHNGGTVQLSKELAFERGKATLKLNQNQLAEGVSNITLFNENGIPIAERLYFKHPKNYLKLEVKSDKLNYGLREKVSVDFSVAHNKPVKNFDFSVSIAKIDENEMLGLENIISSNILTSALKGRVQSPAFYLQNSTESNIALDNLLITQGWRRFNFNDLKEKKPVLKFLPEYSGHIITGNIVKPNGTPIKYEDLFLAVPGKRLQFYQTVSDSIGKFVFNTQDFYDANEIVVVNKSMDTTAKISLYSPFSNQYSLSENNYLNTKKLSAEKIQDASFQIQVYGNFFKQELNGLTSTIIDTTNFYGKAYNTYVFNNYERFNTMEESFREFVKETFVSKTSNGYQIRLLANDVPLQGNPLVLLDGVPYFNMNKVMQIDPTKIAKLEIVPASYQLGSSLFDGIISLSSYKTTLANVDISPNALVLDYNGLQSQREFYSPNYDIDFELKNTLPDFRSTLYWNPKIALDENSKAKLDFFTSDLTGTYIGVLNGIDGDGLLGTSFFTFKVDKR